MPDPITAQEPTTMPDRKTTSETTATSSPRTDPLIPTQLWGLWNDDSDYTLGGFWVLSIDNAPHGNTYLICFSEAEATFAAAFQNKAYDLDCRPVRIK